MASRGLTFAVALCAMYSTAARGFSPARSATLGIRAVFDYARENQYFVLNVFHSISLSVLRKYLKSRCKPIILKMIEDRESGQNLSEESKDFVADFYSAQIINIVCEWIESGMSIKYEEKLRKTEQLIAGSMDYVIEKVVNTI